MRIRTTEPYSTQKQRIYAVLLIIILGASVYSVLSVILRRETWNEARILDALNVAIPEDASNIFYEGEWQGYARHLRLQFEADPAKMHDFATTFCTGILHPGYDPYNSIRVVEPVQHQGTVRIDYSTNVNQQPVTLIFYAYSPIASGKIWGNNCHAYNKNGDLTGSVLLRIDRSETTQYSILLEYYAHHYAYPLALNELDVRPMRDMPILARRLLYDRSRNRYLLHPDDGLCLEVDPLAYLSNDEDWRWLARSIAQITIDGKQLPEAYISSLGTLTPKYNQEGALFNENERYFNYCYYEEWEDGEHTIEISVTDLAANNFAYSWTFYTQ